MSRYVLLLKGINVGRHNRLAMADLRAQVTAAGGEGVRTLLQSGNVVCDSTIDVQQLGDRVRDRLVATGIDVPVVVRTAARFAEAARADPLGDVVTDPARALLGFFGSSPAAGRLASLDSAIAARQAKGGRDAGDRYRIVEDHLYLWCATSVHQSIFATVDWDRLLGVPVTMRNRTTVDKLLELTATPG